MNDLTFTDDEAPVAYTRDETPNPFLTKVLAMAEDWNSETDRSRLSARFTAPEDEAKVLIRQLRTAVTATGKGLRMKTSEVENGKITVKFQLAARKVGGGRPRKEPTAPATPAPKAPVKK